MSCIRDAHHKHIVTGDLKIIKNNKLRLILSKGTNFREPRFLNYDKCLTAIRTSFSEFEDSLEIKYKLDKGRLNEWKNEIFRSVEDKIGNIKLKIKPRPTGKIDVVIFENFRSWKNWAVRYGGGP